MLHTLMIKDAYKNDFKYYQYLNNTKKMLTFVRYFVINLYIYICLDN